MASIFQNGAFFMGFDMDPTASLVFSIVPGGTSMSNTITPFGFGYSAQLSGTPGFSFGTNLTTVYVGFRFYSTILPGTSEIIAEWFDVTADATQVTLRIFADGHLQFYLGSGTGTPLGSASGTGLFAAAQWVYLETKVVINGSSAGSVALTVNGTSAISQTGITTQSTANTWVSGMIWTASTGTVYLDDVYMLDNTGSSPLNTYLGPVQVRGEAPNANSGVGGRNAWTPTNPTNVNHSNVANIPANAAEYNADATVGDYDMFQFPTLPSNTGTIFAVDEWALTLIDSSGARTIGLNCYSGGTDSLGSAFTPGTTAAYTNLCSVVDPHTSSAWTVSNAQAAELGVKVVS